MLILLSDDNECASSPCRNGAQCINKIGGYVCECLRGYVGINCQFSKSIYRTTKDK